VRWLLLLSLDPELAENTLTHIHLTHADIIARSSLSNKKGLRMRNKQVARREPTAQRMENEIKAQRQRCFHLRDQLWRKSGGYFFSILFLPASAIHT